MGKFKNRSYKIIFLVDRDKKVAVIDKSYAKDLRAVWRKHRYGAVSSTADLFGEGPNRAVPLMYVIPVYVSTRAHLEKEIAIWAKVFEKAGYSVRLKPEVRERFNDGLFEKLLDYEIERRSISDILENDKTLCLHHEQGTREERSKGGVGRKQILDVTTDVLNIRVRKSTSKRFRDFCEETDLTQDRALATLLDLQKEIEGDGEARYEVLRKALSKAEAETDAAKRKVADWREWYNTAVKEGYLRRKDQMYELRKSVVREFLNYCPMPVDTKKPSLRRYSHRVAKEEGWHTYYEYPPADGVAIVKIECCSYGRDRNAPLFIFGETLEGQPIKLRFYYKRTDYFGISIRSSQHSREDSVWICAYMVSEEGAADLVGALPLPQSWIEEKKKSDSIQVREEVRRSIILNDEGEKWSEPVQVWKNTRNYDRTDDKIKIARQREKEQPK